MAKVWVVSLSQDYSADAICATESGATEWAEKNQPRDRSGKPYGPYYVNPHDLLGVDEEFIRQLTSEHEGGLHVS